MAGPLELPVALPPSRPVCAPPAGRRQCLWPVAGLARHVAFVILGLLPAAPLVAETALVIRDDAGGSLVEREAEVRALARSGRRVEIRGRRCLSACTLYLALDNICTEPQVRFGFHGPGSQIYGIALPPGEFELWSRRMAAAYPPPLRRWFLARGRHVTVGLRLLPGRELIAMGIPQC